MPIFSSPQYSSDIYEYPAHLRDQAAAAPAAPGVYLFYAEHGGMPLYIGKSVNIRSRLLAHLRNEGEARMLRHARRIEFQCTAGEISALLKESRLIKELQPLYNKRLRRNRRLCSLLLHDGLITFVDTSSLIGRARLFGLFRSRRAATDAIVQLADLHGLCLASIGIEKPTGRPCFRAQLRKCRGACTGAESLSHHAIRLESALEHLQIHQWPHPGAIALYERHENLEEYHVVNRWHYLGSYTRLADTKRVNVLPPPSFDSDCYKILVRPIMDPSSSVIHLS